MTTKADYTDDEWFLISSLPAMLGAAVAAIDKSGIIGTVREMSASMKAGMAAVRDYPDCELIQAIVSRQGDRKQAIADAKEHRGKLLERAREAGAQTPEQHAAQALVDCTAVADLLESKASPEEATAYKQWASSIALEVAEAAKEGGFGFGAGDVSDKEAILLAQIKDALRY